MRYVCACVRARPLGHNQILELLIDKKADVTIAERKSGTCPLHMAAANGLVATCLLLVQNGGADVDQLDDDGYVRTCIRTERTIE